MPDPTTTNLFRPVLIETVEQAEQLPAGVEVRDPDPEALPCIWRKNDDGDFRGPDGVDYTASELLAGGPIEALVPVTATIEMARTSRTPEQSHLPIAPRGAVVWRDLGYMIATRYTTPWTPEEEA